MARIGEQEDIWPEQDNRRIYGQNRRIGQENPKMKSNDQKSYETVYFD